MNLVERLVGLLDQVEPVGDEVACGRASRAALAYTADRSIATWVTWARQAGSRSASQAVTAAEFLPLNWPNSP
jgi:hypothetical protein